MHYLYICFSIDVHFFVVSCCSLKLYGIPFYYFWSYINGIFIQWFIIYLVKNNYSNHILTNKWWCYIHNSKKEDLNALKDILEALVNDTFRWNQNLFYRRSDRSIQMRLASHRQSGHQDADGIRKKAPHKVRSIIFDKYHPSSLIMN